MALQEQKLPLNFAQGEDTKTDPKQIALGKLSSLSNATLISPKRIQKKPGNSALSQSIEGGGSISAGAGIAPFKNELELLDGTSLYSYNAEDTKWVNKGRCISADISTTTIFKDKFDHSNQDVAYHSSGLYIYVSSSAYNSTTNLGSYSIVDSTTGEFLVNSATIANSATLVPAVVGSNFILIYRDTATTTKLSYVAIPIATPLTPSAAVDIATTVGATAFDVCNIGTSAYFAWRNNTGGISMRSMSSTLVLSAITTVAGEPATTIVTFADATLSQMWVVYNDVTNLKYLVRDSSLGAILAPTVLEATGAGAFGNATGVASNGSGNIFWTKKDAGGDTRYYSVRLISPTNTGTGIAPAVFLLGASVTVRAFFYGTTVYLGVTYLGLSGISGITPQATAFIVSINKIGNKVPQVIAKLAPSLTPYPSLDFVPRTVSPSTGVYVFPLIIINELFTGNFAGGPIIAYYTLGVSSYRLNFVSQNNYLTSEYGNNLFLSGGFVQSYDGSQVTEHNFHVYPDMYPSTSGVSPDFVVTNAGGNIEDNKNYNYIVTYEWMDAYGQVQVSSTSVPVQVNVPNTGLNTSKVTITIPNLRITGKSLSATALQSPVLVVVYRTQKNSSGPYYRVFKNNVLKISDPTVQSVTVVDTFADATIITQGQLYTTGGVVENAAPPATCLLTTYKQRVLALSSENRNQFYFSEQVLPGQPVTFSDLLTWNVDTYGGDVTAWNQMDDKLVLFKAREIFYMVGDGPTVTGSQNDFTVPQIVPSDGGTSNPRSVCLTPFGILFQSPKGWYLLDRSLSCKYIGADVEAYNSRTVLKTVLVPNTTQVRVFLDSGTILTFDYFLNQWHHGSGQSSVDACLFQSAVCFLSSGGLVQQQSSSVYTDNSAFVSMVVQTSWIQMADLQGFQRVRELEILGEYKSPHNLVVEIAYDFDPTVAQTVTIPVTSTVTPYQFRVFLAKQKCEAFRLTVYDTQNGTAGESFSLSGITFTFGVKMGMAKVSAAKSYG